MTGITSLKIAGGQLVKNKHKTKERLKMIVLSVDTSKIDKKRLKTFKRRDGSEGVSLELVLIPTQNSEFGDFMVKQSITKEEREAGVQLPILGNAKNLERGGTRTRPQPAERRAPTPQPKETDKSDLPF